MSPFRSLSAGVRFAAMTCTAFTVLLGFVGGLAYWQFGGSLREPVDRGLAQVAAAQVAQLRAAGPGAGVNLLTGLDTDSEGPLDPGDLDAQLLDADGRVLRATEGLTGVGGLVRGRSLVRVAAGAPVHGDRTVREDTCRFVGVPVDDGTGRIVVVGVSTGFLSDAENALLAVFVPAAIAGSALAGLAGLLITRRGLRPLRRMAAQAEAIGAYDLSQRLPTPERHDEIGQLGRTLNHMLERLDIVVRREREFVADASHELRTPLAIARAETELVRDEMATTDPGRAGLTSALEEIDRLSAVVEDLMLLARVDDGVVLDRPEPIHLGHLADTTVKRFALVANARELTLEAHGTARVTGDLTAVERALANLVDNALRHTPAGGNVQITVDQRGAGAALTVRDTGPGADPKLLGTLFNRFTRSRTGHGVAGLGLSIVAAVAASHGGTVAARNLPTGGLEVTFTVG